MPGTRRNGRQAIARQLAVLTAWLQDQPLAEDRIYIDEGYSGARLGRLRDAGRDGAADLVAVFSPDRLARRYAYQVLLLEEFRWAGCDVIFVQHPLSDDPYDQILLQIQGAIAEHERALLGERFRRGKLQRARAGQWLGHAAPYGYRYVPKRDGCPAHLEVHEEEAAMVRMLYGWLIDQQLTIRQILKRLNFGPWVPVPANAPGRRRWSTTSGPIRRTPSPPTPTATATCRRSDREPRSAGATRPRTFANCVPARSGSPSACRR